MPRKYNPLKTLRNALWGVLKLAVSAMAAKHAPALGLDPAVVAGAAMSGLVAGHSVLKFKTGWTWL